MKITEIQIDFIKPKDGLVAFASLVVNDDIYLSSIGIYKKFDGSGYRLTYPSKGSHSVFYPINRNAGLTIENEIFKKLNDVIKKVNQPCQNLTNIH
tara:strand:+ start:851 stop:1138 length:288 start_codon:yes stop_codon:yes gene_type:complete